MKEINKIYIIGMGALGILYGKCIADAMGKDTVTYVVNEERFPKYQNKKITCNGEECSFNISVDTDVDAADLVIVAVKSTGLDAALDTMKNSISDETVIMSVMNGISSEEIIGGRYGMEKMIYTVAQGMDAMKFGDSLKFTRSGELRIGIANGGQQENLDSVVSFLKKVNLAYTVEEDILYRLWGKFMLNVGVNQTCMVYETTYSGVCEVPEYNRTFISAMREVIAIATAEGINIGEKDINQYVAIIKTLSPDGVPSMAQDRINKNRSEVEMFAGTVMKIAKKHGIHVPVNEFLYERVAQIESEY